MTRVANGEGIAVGKVSCDNRRGKAFHLRHSANTRFNIRRIGLILVVDMLAHEIPKGPGHLSHHIAVAGHIGENETSGAPSAAKEV